MANSESLPKKLSDSIRKNGFTYKLVIRGNNSAVYSQHDGDVIAGYEVFKLKVKQARLIAGIPVPAMEVFPPNEAFGVWAWSLFPTQLIKAMEVFQQLEIEQATTN